MDILELPKEVGGALMIVVVLILLDFIFGVLISIKDKTFDLRKLPQFICSSILPYVGGLLVLAIVAQFIGNLYLELFILVSGLVAVKYLANLKDKVFILFGLNKAA